MPAAPAPKASGGNRTPLYVGLFLVVAVLSIAGLRWMQTRSGQAPGQTVPASQESDANDQNNNNEPAPEPQKVPRGGGNG